MSPPLEEMKAWLNEKLGREVTVSQINLEGNQLFLADYINRNAPAKKLASESEDGAIANLFSYLQGAPDQLPLPATKE